MGSTEYLEAGSVPAVAQRILPDGFALQCRGGAQMPDASMAGANRPQVPLFVDNAHMQHLNNTTPLRRHQVRDNDARRAQASREHAPIHTTRYSQSTICEFLDTSPLSKTGPVDALARVAPQTPGRLTTHLHHRLPCSTRAIAAGHLLP